MSNMEKVLREILSTAAPTLQEDDFKWDKQMAGSKWTKWISLQTVPSCSETPYLQLL